VFARACFVTLWLCLVSSFVIADQITLKNGDRLTGTIVSADGKSLNLKTDYAGDVTIKWDSVQSISSDQPLYVTPKTGAMVVGTVTTSDGKLEVATKDAGTITVEKDAVKNVRSESEQRAYGAWGGFLDSGLSLARGNADSTNFTVGATASRITEKNKASAFINSIYSSGTTNGVSLTTASAVHAGLRFDLNLSDKTFAFVFTDFDHDRFQQLDLRNVLGGGLGYHVIKTDATNFDIFGGGSFNQEYFTTFNRHSAEALVGESLDHKLSSAFSIKQRLEFYPNLSSLGDYRVVFDTGAITKINKVLSWELTASDHYITNPVNGLKGNDLLLTTGVRLAFGANKGL
jgi:putative salt-induced outer membrane protein YdiY